MLKLGTEQTAVEITTNDLAVADPIESFAVNVTKYVPICQLNYTIHMSNNIHK